MLPMSAVSMAATCCEAITAIDAVDKLAKKVKAGGSGVWGPVPMPANASISEADAKAVVQWILDGAK